MQHGGQAGGEEPGAGVDVLPVGDRGGHLFAVHRRDVDPGALEHRATLQYSGPAAPATGPFPSVRREARLAVALLEGPDERGLCVEHQRQYLVAMGRHTDTFTCLDGTGFRVGRRVRAG